MHFECKARARAYQQERLLRLFRRRRSRAAEPGARRTAYARLFIGAAVSLALCVVPSPHATAHVAEALPGPASDGPNWIDDSVFFVTQHYRDFFDREPDRRELVFWVDRITQCSVPGERNPGETEAACIERKRIDVSTAFFLSIEFQETGYLVYRLYHAALSRANGLPRLAEFLPDMQRIRAGVIVGADGWEHQLEANKAAFIEEFVARAEFTALYPLALGPEAFVDDLHAHASLVATEAERREAIDEFAGAATSADTHARARVLRRVAESEDLHRRERNRAFVLMQYFGYLRRNPDDPPDNDLSGYNFWLTKLDQFDGDVRAAEMVKAFIASPEYRNRFREPVTAEETEPTEP